MKKFSQESINALNKVWPEISCFCQICGFTFDSNFRECKKCQYYQEGLNKFGRTKSNEEYQLEYLKECINKEKV